MQPLCVASRKYLGSKRMLAETIKQTIKKTSGAPEVFFDVFLGTGSVSQSMMRDGVKKIVAVDNLLSNTIIFTGFFPLPEKEEEQVTELTRSLNLLEGREGYLASNFSGTYFSRENCMRMDRIRDEIETLFTTGMISAAVHARLLAGFLLSADRAANTIGQYDAYLKNMAAGEFLDGKHVSDRRIYEPFMLHPLELLPEIMRDIRTEDVFNVVDDVHADTAYCDPPYNTRQYSTNYHLLENIARWEKPQVTGKTKKMNLQSQKSPFSMRRKARFALQGLLSRLDARHVYLSYSSEGILSQNEIEEMLGAIGRFRTWEFPYPVFGNGAGVSRRRKVTELFFYVEKIK